MACTEKSSESLEPPLNSHFNEDFGPSILFWGFVVSVHLFLNSPSPLRRTSLQAKKTTKTMKKTTRTRKILIISQRLEETDWKYFRISVCAASTLSWVSSTLASILGGGERKFTEVEHITFLFVFPLRIIFLIVPSNLGLKVEELLTCKCQ